jgi:hypothetical protein
VKNSRKSIPTIRWILGVLLVVAGVSATWAWGEAARLAAPAPAVEEPPIATLYAAWQPAGAEQPTLFRKAQPMDEGSSWEPLALPNDLGG